jgi:hypothetical protein
VVVSFISGGNQNTLEKTTDLATGIKVRMNLKRTSPHGHAFFSVLISFVSSPDLKGHVSFCQHLTSFVHLFGVSYL